jgi:flagellar secretion chaperone FliS
MSGIAAYQEMGVLTQTPGRLVVMLYDGAIKALRQAILAMQEKDFERKAKCFGKAIAIIHELNGSLDVKVGGELADNLRRLYLFMIDRLNEASMNMDTNAVEHVISLLGELNSAWKEIAS